MNLEILKSEPTCERASESECRGTIAESSGPRASVLFDVKTRVGREGGERAESWE